VAPELKAQNELLLSSSKGLALATSQLILASKVVSTTIIEGGFEYNCNNGTFIYIFCPYVK
jgi:hypothetical protein